MPEIGLHRFGRIFVFQGQIAVGVGHGQPADLSQDHGLNDGESLGRPVFEVAAGFRSVEAVEEFPGCVAQVEKGLAVFPDEVATVFADV